MKKDMPISKLRKNRLKKLENIKKFKANPYPAKTKRTHLIEEALLNFEKFSKGKKKIVLVGRIRSIREHGGSTFLHFEDGTGTIQGYFKKNIVGLKKYRFFLDNFETGDFIEIEGKLFNTRKGEKTIEASDFKILAKSLLPLPEKWHGLKDVEERFRKRYLDLIMNPKVREKFKVRSKIVKTLREILNKEEFFEVETPILQPIPGGALAKPFKTHLNALNIDLYLRVAPELYLKRLLVGGFEKIYEIGRCFRNEGIDAYHNPDFTMLELYWAYQDRDGLMKFVENIFKELLSGIGKGNTISYQGKKINFKTPWKRIKYSEIDFEKDKEKLIQPTFVVDHPLEITPLAKAKDDNKKYADRFQLVAGGIELINGFSELNNPLEQRERLSKNNKRKDEDFLQALEYGMPPAAGFGIGIDRLSALLTDSHSLREIILFPTMRPKKK